MLSKGMMPFFRARKTVLPVHPQIWFEKQLAASGLKERFPPRELKSRPTARVYYNAHYLDTPAIRDSFIKVPAVNVAGDRSGIYQNGLPISQPLDFFANILPGHPALLSPEERVKAGKKIVYSNSKVDRSGGYPYTNPTKHYKSPFNVGIFSLAGAAFENLYLHYPLFMLDPHNPVIKPKKFAHLYKGLPTEFIDAKNILGPYDGDNNLTRIRTGFPYLGRTQGGTFYPTFGKSNAVIFESEAYFRHQLEDVSLLLTSVNDAAEESGKPALLKATAVGMGFFAKIDGSYDVQHVLYPYFLRAFRKLLSEKSYPWIKGIEFPVFNELQETQFGSIFEDVDTGHVHVYSTSRDVLEFTEHEREEYFPCVINPSDSFALTGNEWGKGSVEASIGLNSSLRLDQVHHSNELILDPAYHVPVSIKEDYTAEILRRANAEALQQVSRGLQC